MYNVLICPASSKIPARHFAETILNSIPLTQIAPTLTATELADLKSIYPDGQARIWGLTAGAGNIDTWEELDLNDVALFYASGMFHHQADVLYKAHNKALADSLWDPDSDRGSFEYVFFLGAPKAVSLPLSTYNELVGYKPDFIPLGTQFNRGRLADALRSALGIEIEIWDGQIDPAGLDAEGRRLYRLHLVAERSKSNREKVLTSRGCDCEVCGFQLSHAFGPEFVGYAEVHHKIQVSDGERKPKPEEFAVLCANCHRAAHFGVKTPRSVEQLISLRRKFGAASTLS